MGPGEKGHSCQALVMPGPVGTLGGRFLEMSIFSPRDLLGCAWWETWLQPWGAEGMRGGDRGKWG